MARNTKPSPTTNTPPATGTERVFVAGKVTIPGPVLPAPLEKPPVAKVEKKPAEKAPPPFTVVPSNHIVKTLAVNTAQDRLVRLKNLARTNRDVAWLLSEFESLKNQKEKSN